jgi:N-acetylglucosaminyldiphosphoundecaprenol N-acetyl-beta-D-mannosaminyltransferase
MVLGCSIDRLNFQQTVQRCDMAIAGRQGIQQVSINALKIVMMREDPAVGEAVREAAIVSADGAPVVWASRLLGDPLPSRVAGADLMHGVLALCERKGYRPYILGAQPEVLHRAVAALRRQYPRLRLAGYRDGYFGEAERPAIEQELNDRRPDVLFIAMSSPAKEDWGRVGVRIGVPLSMGVGGAIDIVAGETRRAPRWMRELGLEWLFRFAQEPRRLGGRYARSNTKFMQILASELVRHYIASSRRRGGS